MKSGMGGKGVKLCSVEQGGFQEEGVLKHGGTRLALSGLISCWWQALKDTSRTGKRCCGLTGCFSSEGQLC